MVTDFFENEVHVGDECVFIEPNYHELKNGVVISITPCGATVKFISRKGYVKTVSRKSNQIIVYK